MAKLLTTRGVIGRGVRDERGVGVPVALSVVVIVFILGMTWTQVGIHSDQRSGHERGREQALNAAEAGVNLAMSRLSVNSDYTGESGAMADEDGEYEVTVAPIDPSDPQDNRRIITAEAWSPSKTALRAVKRVVEAQVEVESTAGFRYALFADTQDIGVGNTLDSVGDIYARQGISGGNGSEVLGDIVTPKHVQLGNNSVVSGSIYADEDVQLGNNSVAQGSILARKAIQIGDNAVVEGDVQTGLDFQMGNNASVLGGVSQNSPPPFVPQETMPTFTWNAGDYSPAPATWSSTSAFRTNWLAKATARIPFNGHHKINDTATLNLDRKWSMDADVTIVTDGPVVLKHSITNATSDILDLVIVSTSPGGIEITNGATIPDSIRLLWFAPNGPLKIQNNKHLTGVFYAAEIDSGNDLDVTFAAPDAPGFTWGTGGGGIQYRVLVRVVRDVTGQV